MPMSKLRKKLQDRLRRVFKWSTNTNYNRGTMLIKPNASTHLYTDPKYVIDLCVDIDDQRILNDKERAIAIGLIRYNNTEFGIRTRGANMYACISFEELELIYNIAKEKMNEMDSSNNAK